MCLLVSCVQTVVYKQCLLIELLMMATNCLLSMYSMTGTLPVQATYGTGTVSDSVNSGLVMMEYCKYLLSGDCYKLCMLRDFMLYS